MVISFFFVFLQLFYLVTHLYKEGTGKEMRKWAYEIHSSFLGPGAVSSDDLIELRNSCFFETEVGIFRRGLDYDFWIGLKNNLFSFQRKYHQKI